MPLGIAFVHRKNENVVKNALHNKVVALSRQRRENNF